MLSNPATARKGNLIAALVCRSLFSVQFFYTNMMGIISCIIMAGYSVALLLVAIIGTLAAKKVKMTAMPEMVSMFNGMGGACAALISIVEFNHLSHNMTPGLTQHFCRK